MVKSFKENVTIIIIVLLVIMSTLLVGTPIEEDNVFPIYIVFGVFSVFYFFIKLIKRDKISINRLDILIGLLVFSAFMPLLGSSYASLSNTIYGIIKYFVLFISYIIVKNECKKNPKYIDIIINTIIFSILFLCIIGIDEINFNILENFKKVIGYKYIQYDEIRIGSLFSYPNTMAAVCGVGTFLCLRNIFKSDKKSIKVIYSLILLFMLITLVLTYSRLAFVIFAFIVLIFILILLKKYKIREKINKKAIITIGSIILVLVVYVLIGINIPKKVKVEDEYQKIIYSAEGNKDYEFKFDIIAKSDKESFSISITEKNKYFDDINKTEESFGNFEGEKVINVHTKEDTAVIYINIKNDDKNAEFIINGTKINDEQFILEYKFLPTNVVDKISNISFNNKSAWERFTFVNDALKIIKENWIFGVGYNAWQTMQYGVQDYNYYSQEVHNFLIQIFLENGLIGFVSCIGVFIYIINKTYKEAKKENIDMSKISYLLGINFLLVHSLFDFNMSFFYVSFIIFILISIISSQENNEKEIKINGIIFYIVFIIMSIVTIYVAIVKNNFNKESEMLKVNSVRTEEVIFSTYNELIPFDREVRNRYYKSLNNQEDNNVIEMKNILEKNILTERYDTNNLDLTNFVEFIKSMQDENDIDFIVDYIKETEEYFKYQPELQIQRFNNMIEIIEVLENKNISTNELKEQIKDELEYKESYILDYQKCRYPKEKVEEYKQKIEYLKIFCKE